MGATWFKETCKKCNTINWICILEGDIATVDPEGVKCRECGRIEFFGGEKEFEIWKEISGWETIEDCYWVLGEESPS